MFTLHAPDGRPLKQRDGEPFRYSTRELANMGLRYLTAATKQRLTVRKAA